MSSAERTHRREGWWRSAPVLMIAVLALVVSTAGGAYAVAKNSIGTKQLKNNAVTSGKIKSNSIQSSDIRRGTVASSDIKDGGVGGADVQDGSLTSGDFAPGQLAPIPAASSRVYFANVNPDGSLAARSRGILSSSRVATGFYRLTMDFDPQQCAAVATSLSSTTNAGVSPFQGAVDVYVVDVGTVAASNVDFKLVIVC